MQDWFRNSKMKPFYITTTLPYVNAELHMGHALEFIRADVIARYRILVGDDVFFNSGTDEHGSKIFKKAQEEGIEVKKFVDDNVKKFYESVTLFGLTKDIHFIRTSDVRHVDAAKAFWLRVKERGFIYKKNYQTKYCIGCETEKTDSELVDGKCPEHQNSTIEFIDEENYFFKFSEFQKPLLEFYKNHSKFVIPDFRFNELRMFVERGLDDFSISRLKSKMPWGIEVPGDESHVMYVWFDALVSYIANIGWPTDEKTFTKYWKEGTPTQYCGKDNTRFQGAMWQAMLMAAGLSNSYQIVVNGHITAEGGLKMSKSLGNVVDPKILAQEYGTDALRFFLLKEISSFEDSPFTIERFKDSYNAHLANGLGNLVSRIMKMAEGNNVTLSNYIRSENNRIKESVDKYDIKSAMDSIWHEIMYIDGYIQEHEPFKKIKTNPEEAKKDISQLLKWLRDVAEGLTPFLPETAEKIKKLIQENRMPEKPLFPRKD